MSSEVDVPQEPTQSFRFIDPSAAVEDRQRLSLLRRTGLLTAHNRPALDAITHLAAETTGAHVAIVSLVDVDRQVFPSYFGAEGHRAETSQEPISHSFCKYVVANDAPLVVEDATAHPVLASHPAVVDGNLAAYAGFPVHAPTGEVLGALCVLHEEPRAWTRAQLSALKDLATSVDTKIALRLSRRELHLDHERLMHVLDGASHTLIIIVDVAGVIRTMNLAAERALGLSREFVGKRRLSDLAGFPALWAHRDGLDDAQDWVLQRPTGGQRTFSVRVTALHDPEGEVDGYIAVGDDVSARRRTEQLLRDALHKQTEVVNRLKALEAERSTFVATASHELRTPVASILGYTELLADGECGELNPDQDEVVKRVVRNAHRLNHLIEDLLTWDRTEPERCEPVRTTIHVRRLTEHVVENLRVHLAERDVRLDIHVPHDMPNVYGDHLQLERALLNLLTNAVKFTPDGGSVRLSVGSSADGAEFTVTDTGCGIPEDDLEAVFEPFFRTQEARRDAIPGSGIGLAVVRRIVMSHGGELALTSKVNEGTTVRFTIPDTVAVAADEDPRVA